MPNLERSVDGSKYTLTRCYHYDNLKALAEEAARCEGKANIYFTLNPVWEELVGTGVPADDDFITSRQYIYVDIDPVRYDASGKKASTDLCTMDAEKAEGFLLMEAVQEYLTSTRLATSRLGWTLATAMVCCIRSPYPQMMMGWCPDVSMR